MNSYRVHNPRVLFPSINNKRIENEKTDYLINGYCLANKWMYGKAGS